MAIYLEYEGLPNGLLIVTACCHVSNKSEQEEEEYLQQALVAAVDHAEKHVKKGA